MGSSIRTRQRSYGPKPPRPSTALVDSTVIPALRYAAETWSNTAASSRKLLIIHRTFERCLLKFRRRTQHITGLRGSDLRAMFLLRDLADYISEAKYR
ncbi:hypothetical protein RB195_025390 [Necator americanus]|uniref:Uncharacterized protein n=1 Tax=Necator americanus TaxID=51031 RepID=A0ABR1EUC3_NECAM